MSEVTRTDIEAVDGKLRGELERIAACMAEDSPDLARALRAARLDVCRLEAREHVVRIDNDAGLAREAALREELANLKNGFKWESERATLLLEALNNCEGDLAAAEQRNAELVASIVALPDEFKELSGCENTAGVYACIDYISDWVDELGKPTESGASE